MNKCSECGEGLWPDHMWYRSEYVPSLISITCRSCGTHHTKKAPSAKVLQLAKKAIAALEDKDD